MIKLALMVSLFSLMLACSGGGSGSSTDEPNATDDKTNQNPEDFVLSQLNTLKSYSKSEVLLELKNLPTDDAVYVTVSSDQLENKKLQVFPYKTVINPNEGAVQLTLNVTDQGSTSAPQIHVLVTTSGNQNMEKTLNMEWQSQ